MHEAGFARLRSRPGLTWDWLPDHTEAEMLEHLRRADAVLLRTARLTREMIEQAPRLRAVSRHGVGVDNVDVAACTERGIPVAVSVNANSVSVAEHAFFLMMALAKHALAHDRAVRDGRWKYRDEVRATELLDKSLLLIGFGRVGQELARRALAFGMRVDVYDPFVDAAAVGLPGVRKVDDLGAALEVADFVSICAPRTEATYHLIGRDALARMKSTAVIVNTSRGGIIDELALADALREGQIAGAGLDVLESEPPPPDHPLLGLENVVLSPHIAGITAEAMVRMAEIAADHVLAGLDGRLDPAVVVNPEVL